MEMHNLRSVCFHVLERSSLPFVKELTRQVAAICPNARFCFVAPHASVAAELRAYLSLDESVVASDPATNLFAHHDSRLPLSDHELEEAARIEREYLQSEGLWSAIFEDRYMLYSGIGTGVRSFGRYVDRNVAIRMGMARFRTLESHLKKHEVDQVVYTSQDCGTPVGSTLYRVAAGLDIRVRMPICSRFQDRWFFASNYVSPIPSLEEKYRACLSMPVESKRTAFSRLDECRERGVSNPVTAWERRTGLSRLPLKALSFVSSYYDYLKHGKHNHFSPLEVEFDRRLYRARKLYVSWRLKPVAATALTKFVYFPLHIEPELATLICAPYHTDQLSVLHNLARSLPADTVLAVKEHPAVVGGFPLSFYRQIRDLPNTMLVDPNENSQELIRSSVGVATITGSAGFEAMLMRKPVITFGNVFYNVCDSVHNVGSWQELPGALLAMNTYSPDDNDIASFLQALLDVSFPIKVLQLAQATERDPELPAMTTDFIDAAFGCGVQQLSAG